ncbi:MAG: DEAD/DEAH box helicase family protein [Lachnospiraceae bacterium]|nr:DEAD/DEAH box helicase family protein [Lachnospiraceae bacterium]
MIDLLSKLSSTSQNKPIEPREIFMSLPTKDKQYEYPRDVQSEVWKKWFEKRDQKNTIIKMNTGSGKTVVGLMILQSCLNEWKGPAIYVVPDNYLVSQVYNEASRLGILATTDPSNYKYTVNEAILVIPIQKLVNGKSVFGMRSSNTNYPIGSILLDDVHACMDTITSQFSLRIPYEHELYNKIISLFSDAWKAYDNNSYIDIVEMKDPQKNSLLPFWIWQDKQDEVYSLLRQYDNDNEENQFIFFSLPLLSDCLSSCNCMITTRSIEITPKGIPISKIKSFENATRRIFMSATLADDSVFVSALGLKENGITDIITPDKANDIGDRLILFPQHLNSSITDIEIKEKIIGLSKKYNIVVIVPSRDRGRFWDDTEENIITKDNIESAVMELKQGHVGLKIFLNRYDGIDLPDNACRILVIDGLPPLRSEYDKYVQSINPTSSLLLREQIQRIEQGMGRGVRSNSDSCCVILMGEKLADVLLRNAGISFFSNATKEQYQLSKDLWDLLMQENPSPTVNDIFELANFSLNREVIWIQRSKDRLSTVVYKTKPNFDIITIALRRAYEFASMNQWDEAVKVLTDLANQEIDEKTKGYLMQIKAEYTNFFDRSRAQQILQAARKCNGGVLIPIDGIQCNKAIHSMDQAKGIKEYYTKRDCNPNDFIIHINSVLDRLSFSPDTHDFERALETVGEMLGFKSSRPDTLTKGKGTDNLWAIGDNKYLVFECKSGATHSAISKDNCNQLGGSVRWFQMEYENGYQWIPIMVHPANILDRLATPVPNMKVMTSELLDKLKKQIKAFCSALASAGDWNDEARIGELLIMYKLRGKDIVSQYTTDYRINTS